eukprot:m.43736 g.43736  ORF g.43736 m.43736 type:complete len:229 (-) comp12956_c0_seq2:244-930(-)
MTQYLAMAESDLIRYCAIAMAFMGLTTIIALLSGQRAAYGRYFTDNNGIYLFNMNGKLAWVLQESPCLIIGFGFLLLGANSACTSSPANLALFGLFSLHYIHRTLIFPFFLKGKPTPFVIMLMALVFCLVNGSVLLRDSSRARAPDYEQADLSWYTGSCKLHVCCARRCTLTIGSSTPGFWRVLLFSLSAWPSTSIPITPLLTYVSLAKLGTRFLEEACLNMLAGQTS